MGQVLLEGCRCAQKFPPGSKRDLVRVARRGDLSHAEVAAVHDISMESVQALGAPGRRRYGVVGGQTSSEQSEPAQLRREK